MADAPKYTDEYLDRFFSGIMSLVPRDSEYPRWFACADILAGSEGGYAREINKRPSPAVTAGYAELRLVLDSARSGLDEGVGPKAEKCLRDYVRKCLEDMDKRTGFQGIIVEKWEGELAEGVQRGHHWQFREQLDKHPEWCDRVPRGKSMGWKYTYKYIKRALPNDVIPPSRSSVDRMRMNKIEREAKNSNQPQKGKK